MSIASSSKARLLALVDELKVILEKDDSSAESMKVLMQFENMINKPEVKEGFDAVIVTEENMIQVVNEIIYQLCAIHGIQSLHPRMHIHNNVATIEIFKSMSSPEGTMLFEKDVTLGEYLIYPVKVKGKYE